MSDKPEEGDEPFDANKHWKIPPKEEEEDVLRYGKEIGESHPVNTEDELVYAADWLAMDLVGERHAKRPLVNLVRWLILRGNRDLVEEQVKKEDN